MQLAEDTLQLLDRAGLFAAPSESLGEFLTRVEKIPLSKEAPKTALTAIQVVKQLYEVEPSWVLVEYANDRLHFFEAGCTWVDEALGTPAVIQLKKHFLEKDTLYGLYHRDEILAHEYVHAVRQPLLSERFEEIFAYLTATATASSFLQRITGTLRLLVAPLFRHAKEVWGLLLLLAFVVLGFAFSYVAFALFVLVVSGAFLVGRLVRSWYIFRGCFRVLSEIVEKKRVLALMLRLSDEEIYLISKKNSEDFVFWLQEQQKKGFRWQLFKQVFFS